jgi:hypothetical protein
VPVAPTVVHHLPAFSTAFDRGLGVTELKPTGRAAAEIEALWLDLDKLEQRLAAPAVSKRKGGRARA